METVYCSACGATMSAAAHACPQCGHPNGYQAASLPPAALVAPRGLIGPRLTAAAPTMGFGEAITRFFSDYGKFSGRSRRSEFWFATLFVSGVGFVLLSVSAAVDPEGDGGVFSILYTIWILGLAVPNLALASRRLHDADASFGYYFIGLIPMVGIILLIVKLAQEGTPGENRFGESPKYRPGQPPEQ